jgi:hypothetical protein
MAYGDEGAGILGMKASLLDKDQLSELPAFWSARPGF